MNIIRLFFMQTLGLLMALSTVTTASAATTSAETLSLEQALTRAFAHAPAYLAEESKREASREDVLMARAWLLPYIKASASYSHIMQRYTYDRPLKIPLPNRLSYNDTNFAIQLVQPLFRLDRWHGWEQGKLADEAAEVALQLARQALMLEVANRFANAVAAHITFQATQAQYDALKRMAEMSAARLDAGLGTVTDKLEAESRAELARAELLNEQNNLSLCEARLDSLIGAEHPPLPETLPSPVMPAPSDWEENYREQAMADAPGVKLAQLLYRIADHEVSRSLGTALPSVDFVAGMTHDDSSNGLFGAGSVRRDEMIGIQVDIPVYAGGGTWAQRRKSEQLKTESAYRLDEARREAELSAREASLSLNTAQARVEALSAAVKAAQKSSRAAQSSFEVGLSTIVQVLDAESRLAGAKRDLALANSATMLARLQLAASIGKLEAIHLPLQ